MRYHTRDVAALEDQEAETKPSQICDTISSWKIFDAVEDGKSRIALWIAKEKLGKREIGQLNQKIDMLERNGHNLPPNLLAGPIKSKRNKKLVSHIYKLRLNGDRALRPLLCKGPIEMDREYTMLLGAIEVNSVLDIDAEDAENVRATIVANPRLRKPHERYA
jgi:hypothetical protein